MPTMRWPIELSGLVETARFAAQLTATSGRSAMDLAATRIHSRRAAPDPRRVPYTDYHPFLASALADPYPHYQRLLAGGPVHYNREHDSWIISRYQHVRDALRADTVLSSADGIARQRISLPMMIGMDRPGHTRLRRIVAPDFTRAAIETWRPLVNRLCDDLVADMTRREHVDGVAELAVPLPVQLIATILGIPTEDRTRFHRWSHASMQSFQLRMQAGSLIPLTRALGATVRLHHYLNEHISRRRHGPEATSEDLLTRLVRTAQDGGLSDEQVFWFTFLLLVAGNETTTNLISGLLLTLAQQPGHYQVLREQPALIPAAIEEQLRLHPPVQGFYRTALRDYQVDDHTIPAGSRVLILYAAANRDPRHYPNPDVFDPKRDNTDHLAFGSGAHYCLGAYLSRIEAHRVLTALTIHTENLTLSAPPTWTSHPFLRGLAHLPLRLTSAGHATTTEPPAISTT